MFCHPRRYISHGLICKTSHRFHLFPIFCSNRKTKLNSSTFLTVGAQRQVDTDFRFFSSYKVAIVGSGPSGCYTAKFLQRAFANQQQEQEESNGFNRGTAADWQIDVLERLPTPYGLVRYGVAPDHPEVKNVQNDFDALFEEMGDDGDSNGINFYGNVEVGGPDVSVLELRQLYDAVVLAYGSDSDRKLGIPGEEELSGILSAREFVAWYNGHPDFVHIGDKVAQAIGGRSNDDGSGVHDASVVVIGHGNVALDCARILVKGRKGLFDTDLVSSAMDILGDGVADVSIVGRRGHVQGAFTIKEVRELVKLEEQGFGVSFVIQTEELDMGETDSSLLELAAPAGRPKKRINKLLREAASKVPNDSLTKNIQCRFLLGPARFESDEENKERLGAVVFERNRLEGEPGQQHAVGTGQFETIPADLALVSVGYKGVALKGTEPWFDVVKGVLRNHHGRVDEATESTGGSLGGLYAAGWIKRGPSGIIGTNISDAKDTVATIVHDLKGLDGKGGQNSSKSGDLKSLLKKRGVSLVAWDGYKRIEEKETSLRRSERQPREKITDLKLQIEIALASSR